MSRFRHRYMPSRWIIILFLILFGMGIGYAVLETDLNIVGTSDIDSVSWDVHFENVRVTNGSVAANTPVISNDTTVNFEANLNNPGDYYEFRVDVVNNGSLDAKLGGGEILPTLTQEEKNYFRYNVAYEDGVPISINNTLNVGETETLIVRVEYLNQTDTSLYPTEDKNFEFRLTLNYVQGHGIPIRTYDVGNVVFTVGSAIPSNAVLYNNYLEATSNYGHSFFLKHETYDSLIYRSYVGFLKDNVPYYIRGGGATYNSSTNDYNGDSSFYERNKLVLDDALGTGACTESDHTTYKGYDCTYSGMTIYANSKGYVTIREGSNKCSVYGDGTSTCV